MSFNRQWFALFSTCKRNCKSGNVKRKCQRICVIYVLGSFHGLLLLSKCNDSRAHWETSHSWLGCSGLISCKPSVQVLLRVWCDQRAEAEWLTALHSFWCQNRMCFTWRYKWKEVKRRAMQQSWDRNMFMKEIKTGNNLQAQCKIGVQLDMTEVTS